MLRGGCYCGRVRYQAEGEPSYETNCHCSICRRTTGAPYVAWASFPREGFRFVAGEPTVYRSSDVGTRYFCPTCGCQLAFEYASEPLVDVSLGSLDDPSRIAPRDHTHTSSKLPWVALAHGLPAFPGARPGE